MTPFQKHIAKWRDCQACDLCQGRKQVVFCRGKIPCDVLIVGEAPGKSENILGQPFVGPAGKLLDQILERATDSVDWLAQGWNEEAPRVAFTNIVACIPRNEEGEKVHEPPAYAIKACSERLDEFVRLARPRLIVLVGKYAEKAPPAYDCPRVSIMHPAAILRGNVASQSLMIQRCVVTLSEAFQSL